MFLAADTIELRDDELRGVCEGQRRGQHREWPQEVAKVVEGQRRQEEQW